MDLIGHTNSMWQETNNKLIRDFKFKNFRETQDFINLLADIAEEMNHHPEIHWIYNKIQIELCTHSAGNIITSKDRDLAERIDHLLNE